MQDPFFIAGTGPTLRKEDRIIEIDPRQDPNASRTDHGVTDQSRWRWWFSSMVVVAIIVIARLFELQIVSGDEYRSSAESNRRRIQVIPAPRGSILDRHGNVLAENRPNFVLAIIPADFPDEPAEQQRVLDSIAVATGLPVEELQTKLNAYTGRSTDPAPIVEHLNAEQALPLMITIAALPGVNIIPLPARQYPAGQTSSHLLGYIGSVSPEDIERQPDLPLTARTGKAGLEQEYNEVLTGQDGRREIERDVYNQRHEVLHEQAPITGASIVLGLDRPLQQLLSESLEASIKANRAPGGAAVAIDPRDGSILALASAPNFDSNWFVTPADQAQVQEVLQDGRHPLLNRAIAGQYPSGSIIKPLIAVAGLNEGLITPSTIVNSTGGIQIGRDRFPDWQAGGHGITNLSKAIAESVNTYFYTLGGGHEERAGLGVERIVNYLERFGWGSRIGLDLPGEATGLLPTREWRTSIRATPWRLGDTYHLAIGQGDLQVTPLQVATAVAAIANGGTLFQPRLVTEIQPADGSPLETIPPIRIRSLDVSPGSITAVREGMRQGVLSGSSRALQSLPVTAAGKTGTAQFGTEGKTHAWYTGFAPFENPTIAIAVIIESGGEGHAAALPVAKDVFEWYFRTSNE